jgi:hypothetical protein
MKPVEIFLRKKERENNGGGNPKYIISSCVNITIYVPNH